MIEHVKTVFFQLQKAKNRNDTEVVKKYMTVSGYEKLKKQMEELQAESKMQMIKNSRVKEIAIIDVIPATDKHPDLFTALVKGYVVTDIEDWNTSAPSVNHDDIIRKFSERWCFARQGDWWLLDEMRK